MSARDGYMKRLEAEYFEFVKKKTSSPYRSTWRFFEAKLVKLFKDIDIVLRNQEWKRGEYLKNGKETT